MTVIAAMSIVANTGRRTHIAASFCMCFRKRALHCAFAVHRPAFLLPFGADGDLDAIIEIRETREGDAFPFLHAVEQADRVPLLPCRELDDAQAGTVLIVDDVDAV